MMVYTVHIVYVNPDQIQPVIQSLPRLGIVRMQYVHLQKLHMMQEAPITTVPPYKYTVP